ncbi:GNAT family N-acetyltransferase [Afifella sp. IM 167]|uniref:GNAT family N-acetyltransferase n=1 Tax=Afifella sp. IM 167 TaxID=2033586 RepID=UPI001CCA28BA|nr:GNAT family N-acetyltransferase [Afifella sp. IM 167]MBZ8134729.1 hypothetical protein [Afifella sp. IM 167]
MPTAPSATVFDEPGHSRAAHAASAASPALTGEIVRGAAAFAALAAEWERLAARAANGVFQTPSFLSIWARHFTADKPERFWCVTVRMRGELCLVWPIEICRCGPIPVRIASNAGAPISQYDEILIAPKGDPLALFAAALETLRAAGVDLLTVERVRADSALAAALPAFARRLGEPDAAPFTVTDPEGLKAFLASRKSKLRKESNRRRNALAAIGELELVMPEDPATTRLWLEETLELKRDWLKDKGMVSRAFLDRRTHDCLESFAGELGGSGGAVRLLAPRLTVGGRFAAQEIAFLHNGAYHLFLRAFSPEFAAHGPGNVLTEMVLAWCAEEGILRYDMLPPRFRNKREWQSGEVEVADYAMPLTATGRLYQGIVVDTLKPAIRNLYYALPQGMRSFLAGRTLRL